MRAANAESRAACTAGMVGLPVAGSIRQTRLYMSGYTDSILSTQGVLDQSTSLLYKPFTEEQLVDRVKRVLNPGILKAVDQLTEDRS